MQIEKITMAEFEDILTTGYKRCTYGTNRPLLRGAETTPVKLTFETEKKAISKQTALYVVRRKINAQVRLFRRGAVLFIGPGEYVRTERLSTLKFK